MFKDELYFKWVEDDGTKVYGQMEGGVEELNGIGL